MNFAAQFFYYTFQNDGIPWKASFNDGEEGDPFWQRWETAPPDCTEHCSPQFSLDTPAPLIPGPVALPKPLLPPPSSHLPPTPLPPPPPHLPPLLPPPPCTPSPSPPSPVAPAPPPPGVVEAFPEPQNSSMPSSPLPAFQSLVGLLLRLALSFILLFFCSVEQRIVGRRKSSALLDARGHQGGSVVSSCLARRTAPIHPERLKDFGEEEYLNGDVRNPETKHVDQLAAQRMSKPKPDKKPDSEVKAPTKPKTQPKTPPEAPPNKLCFEDISVAAFKVQSGLQKTPCTYSRLSKQYGMEIFLKKEHLHYTGSVKERGVLYLLTSLRQEQQRKGVIVATDSNFSMAVSHHAAEMCIPVLVIMPASSTLGRVRVYRDYGAMVILYGSTPQHSQNHGRHLAKENAYLYLEEDDSAEYMAGLGTVGMEVCEQVSMLDAVILPVGGNCSLLAGAATAIKHINPRITVIGVELEDYPILLQSLKNDCPMNELHSSPKKKLYGDLLDPPLGGHAFQLAKKLVDKIVSVREEEALVAMLRFQEYERSTIDAEGAIGLAAIVAGKLPELRGKRISVVVSSASMELGLVRKCVERALVLDEQVVQFTVELGDLPGDMAKLLEILAREDIRLLSVYHRRHSGRSDFFKAQVECLVEMQDRTQSSQLRTALSERYPSLCWLDR